MVKKVKIYNNFNISKLHKNSIILIGNFDGLHLGHQKLFQEAKKYKKKIMCKLGVVTFDPMPKMFFNKELKNYRISNLNQKINYFKKYDIDFIVNKAAHAAAVSDQRISTKIIEDVIKSFKPSVSKTTIDSYSQAHKEFENEDTNNKIDKPRIGFKK